MNPDADLMIREYEGKDAEAVKRLHVEALSAIGALYPGPWDDDFDHIDEIYFEPGGTFLVGEVAGKIVAMGALRRLDAVTGEIKRMRVAPEAQRRGLGQLILAALERRAADVGITNLELDTTVGQIAARAFYEKHGYRVVERRRAPHAEQLIFRKTLPVKIAR